MILRHQLTSSIRLLAPITGARMGVVRPDARIFGGRAARGRAP
jgi:hypothetical protein